jgi:peptidoglycan-associated lipoprotein
MPGGYGGFDIWKASRDKASKPFDAPVNLGPKINTSGNEVYPSLRGDSILYFSSDGLPGIGGLDIFMAKLLENSEIGDPENLMCPINSNGDDFGIIFDDTFTVDPETKAPYVEKGFFSSNRIDKTKVGEDNIYYFKLKPLLFTLSGFVKDGSNMQPMDGAEITLSGSDGTIVKRKTDVKGYYFFDRETILPNTTYEISVIQKGYWERDNSATVTTIGLTQNTDLKQDLMLMPIPEEPIVLPEIRYDLAKWDLKDQYKDSLLYVYNILIKNPRLVIELRSHTDFRGTEESNDTLSQRRAESVVEFLVNEKGINPARLIPKGFGERQPRKLDRDITLDGFTFKKGTVLTEAFINGLKTEREKEAAHQLNRRTEMFILRNDFVDTAKKVTAVTKPTVQLVTQRTIPLKLEKDIYTGTAVVNDKSFKYQLDLKSKEVFMSHELATQLLKERTIVASDFEKGSEAINAETGEILDNSILYLNTMVLGGEYIQNVQVTVKKSVTSPLIIGGEFISDELGDFTLDKEKSMIIFNRR